MSRYDEEFVRVTYTWACMQAHQWGWKWELDGETTWVNTGENEIGVKGRRDFVALVSERRVELSLARERLLERVGS